MSTLPKRMTAEFLGTLFLVAAVIGSGIMGDRLSAGNIAIALLANTIATGAALIALILTFGPVSGAHFNPAVTLADAMERGIAWREVPAYIVCQCTGGIAGAFAAHLMFGLPLYSFSQHARHGNAQFFSEFVATFGLLSAALHRRSFCCRVLHYIGLLVHGINIVCQPGSDHCPFVLGYVRRYKTSRCPPVCGCAAGRRAGGHFAIPLVDPNSSSPRPGGSGTSGGHRPQATVHEERRELTARSTSSSPAHPELLPLPEQQAVVAVNLTL